MRILQVHAPYRIPGGEDTVVQNEARLLRASGHELWQFFEPNPTSLASTLASTLAAPWNPLSARELRQRLRAERPDVAHVHNTWFRLSPSIIPVLADAGVPIVQTLHNYRRFCLEGTMYRDGHACSDCLGRSPLPGVRHACYRSAPLSVVAAATQVVQRTRHTDDLIDLFVAPSEFMRSIVVRAGLPAGRTLVKPHFAFDPGPRPLPPSRSDTVLVVGRIAAGKGVDLLLEAWRSLPRDSGRTLEVIGSGPMAQELSATAPDGVRFLSLTHDEVTRRMLQARALVFPSLLNETFGMVVVEAMAAGLPVAGFDVAANREILGPDAGELLGPAADTAALAGLLGRLGDDDLVDRVGAENRESYLQRFSPRVQLPQLEQVYRDTIGRHGVR